MNDIEIARNTKLHSIKNVAKKLNINSKYLEEYGKYKAKISNEIFNDLKENKKGTAYRWRASCRG